MELIFGILATGCMGYLITEVNEMQRELKELRGEIILVQIQLDRRNIPKDIS